MVTASFEVYSILKYESILLIVLMLPNYINSNVIALISTVFSVEDVDKSIYKRS